MNDSVELVEARKKSTQIITAGILGFITLIVGIGGAVKFFPVTQQISRLFDDVERVQKRLDEKDARFNRIESELENNNLSIIDLEDFKGDTTDQLDRHKKVIDANAEAHVAQVQRAETRKGEHKARDRVDTEYGKRLESIEKRLEEALLRERDRADKLENESHVLRDRVRELETRIKFIQLENGESTTGG